MQKSAVYVSITFLIFLGAWIFAHIFLPLEWLSTDLCFKWLCIMLGMCVYLTLYYTFMGDNED